ncbi:rhodanese-like domain-containing protein [Leucobacter sp. CSA2]|uniref:Rhodanese-like domain-containing protein n=1 Tax=Leucobacter edaphi TaxID=2796472 RepID=A0A934QET4_9MICO|nr:rhodanese-like domain-containing protein [Leucobacter edaphi]MBK0422761.1 rhodanese-like domain-containing protein [Leucobacter edaphi]
MRRTLTSILLPLTVCAFGLVACTSAPSSATKLDVAPDTIILDVRTPEEYAAGHLEGAQLLDFTGGAVEAALPSLDPEAEYFVYCRSGNRSGQAIALMERAGFADLTNLGSLEQAAERTGLSVVG